MKAIDTNIVIRLLLRDDEPQYQLARKIVTNGAIIPITVLLETGWLLESRFKFGRADIVGALKQLMDAPDITVAEPAAVRSALDLYAGGADFADAIHLVAARGAEAFVTFGRKMPHSDVIGVDVEIVA
ncbi:MAG: type II toxin-antitoxin system VapC family toxin [Sphingomonadales bacterium]